MRLQSSFQNSMLQCDRVGQWTSKHINFSPVFKICSTFLCQLSLNSFPLPLPSLLRPLPFYWWRFCRRGIKLRGTFDPWFMVEKLSLTSRLKPFSIEILNFDHLAMLLKQIWKLWIQKYVVLVLYDIFQITIIIFTSSLKYLLSWNGHLLTVCRCNNSANKGGRIRESRGEKHLDRYIRSDLPTLISFPYP